MKANAQTGAQINLPASKLPYKKTEEQTLATNFQWQIFRVLSEFIEGFDFISKYKKSVTVFGSARTKSDDPTYKKAYELGKEIAKINYAVVTGGGPGIMEAANRGARDMQRSRRTTRSRTKGIGPSVGLNIQLPQEQRINPYVNESLAFRFFFSRKVMLSFAAEAYVFFPGGFGTMDEFFEVLTLVQTHKIAKVPIILVGSHYWNHLTEFIDDVIFKEYQAIDNSDRHLYRIVDNIPEIIRIIKKAEIREFSTTRLGND